jgi:hypothetical protein
VENMQNMGQPDYPDDMKPDIEEDVIRGSYDEKSDPKEGLIPAVILALGLGLYIIADYRNSTDPSIGRVLLGVGIGTIIGVILGIIVCYITASLLQINFGALKTAILKMAAIIVFAGAIDVLIPYAGWIAAVIVYFCLLCWLFDMSFFEVFIFCAVLMLVRTFVWATITLAIIKMLG